MAIDVFLSYASEDRRRVQQLYRRLRTAGLSCWMDKPPRPWHREGIGPGQEWDPVIRSKLSDARVILALLSEASVAKRGYVQREFRLALQVAAERPANTIAVVPVLLEDCKPPELKVDTVSFQQLQWYELYRYGVEDLVQHLRAVVGWNSRTTQPAAPGTHHTHVGYQSTPLLEFIAALNMSDSSDWRNKPLELFNRALALVRSGDYEAADDLMRRVRPHDQLTAARALRKITDRHAATLAMMMIVGYIQVGKDKACCRAARSLIGHPVPEVRLLAAANSYDNSRKHPRLAAMVRKYADSSDRLVGFHDVLRWHIYGNDYLTLASSHPRFVWELMANNPQFSMKGMRFLPMTDERKTLSALASSAMWETREIGVAIHCADPSIPLVAKLPHLSDAEPRVRFRALQGILMDWRVSDLRETIDMLRREPTARNESRTWTVKMIAGTPKICTVHLDDDEALPVPLSNGFSRGSMFFMVEAGDAARCRMSGFAALSAEGKENAEDRAMEKMVLARERSRDRHWILQVMMHKST